LWAATTPTLLVKEGYFTTAGGNAGRTCDLSSDGQRFLMIKAGGGTDQTAARPQLIVVQHFDEELKRLVPTKQPLRGRASGWDAAHWSSLVASWRGIRPSRLDPCRIQPHRTKPEVETRIKH